MLTNHVQHSVVNSEIIQIMADKANTIWSISKDMAGNSLTLSKKPKSKVPVTSPSATLNSGKLHGLGHLNHGGPKQGNQEGDDQVYLQSVPEHEDDNVGGDLLENVKETGVSEVVTKPRRKFGSLTAYLSHNKQVAKI